MTKREYKWIKNEKWKKSVRRVYREMREKIYDSFFWVNAAASHVYKDEQGNVRVEILTPEQTLDVMQWDNLPDENFAIYKL